MRAYAQTPPTPQPVPGGGPRTRPASPLAAIGGGRGAHPLLLDPVRHRAHGGMHFSCAEEVPVVSARFWATALIIGAATCVVLLAGFVPAAHAENVFGARGPGRLVGTGGEDYIAGGAGDDHIFGRGGFFDYLDGGRGDDAIFGGRGADEYHGGPGDDHLFDNGGADTGVDDLSDGFDGAAGNDRIIDRGGRSFMEDGSGHDVLRSGHGPDSLLVSNGADRVWAGPGSDTVQVDSDRAPDIIRCGPGDDTISLHERRELFLDRYFGCEHFSLNPVPERAGHRPRVWGLMADEGAN